MKAPYTIFNKTHDVSVVTYTDGKVDDPPKSTWDKDVWIERGEDWYAFCNPEWSKGTVRVIERDAWLRAIRQSEIDQRKNPAI